VTVTLFVAVLITDTPTLLPVTYTLFLSGLTATLKGCYPTVKVAITLFVVVSITDTVPPRRFATYTFVPSGVIAIPHGELNPVIVAVIVFVAVSIIDTVLFRELVIYANGAAPAMLTRIKSASIIVAKNIQNVYFLLALSYIAFFIVPYPDVC
jgi:hypothetical protein